MVRRRRREEECHGAGLTKAEVGNVVSRPWGTSEKRTSALIQIFTLLFQ